MAQEPKRRTSKSRKRERASHQALSKPAVQACPRCHQPKLSHNVCPTCGTYDGREVIEVKSKSKK